MDKEFKYFKVHRSNDNSIPLLEEESNCPDYLYENNYIDNPSIMKFRYGKPIPKRPKLSDYYSSPSSIVSQRIADVLNSMSIEKVQLLPATIRDEQKNMLKGYWAVHLYNSISCIDRQSSACEIQDFCIDNVEKIILDKKILNAIPLNKRLAFRLGEDFGYQLFHKSLVDEIIAVNPVGIAFTDIEEWNDGSFFK